jgi:hypothetical protein
MEKNDDSLHLTFLQVKSDHQPSLSRGRSGGILEERRATKRAEKKKHGGKEKTTF